MTKIPEYNLPIYLQNYTVSILSGNEKSGTVDYTTVGIIPSNVSGKKVWNFKKSLHLSLKFKKLKKRVSKR